MSVRENGPWSADRTAAARCFGSELIAKPKSSSCTRGMPTIIAKVTRSRRIWMNSFSTIAQNRHREKLFTAAPPRFRRAGPNPVRQKTKCHIIDDTFWSAAGWGGSFEIVLRFVHQADEHV